MIVNIDELLLGCKVSSDSSTTEEQQTFTEQPYCIMKNSNFDKKEISPVDMDGVLTMIFNEGFKEVKTKAFSNIFKKEGNPRAWEVVQKKSEQIDTKLIDNVLEDVTRAKVVQNKSGHRCKRSNIYSTHYDDSQDKHTVPSSKDSDSGSAPKTHVYPCKFEQKILRNFRKHYKKLFEEYFKKNNHGNFNRKAKSMSAQTFQEILISFMDELFGEYLEFVEEETIEQIIKALSILLLKERYKKKEAITEGLDFSEWNDLTLVPNSKKTIHFFSRKENAFLYAFYFMMECEQLVVEPKDAWCCRNSTQIEEALMWFYQMHELYNLAIPFAPVGCQQTVNGEVNQYLKDIVL